MKIKKITYQNRRDFSAILVCEYCGYEEKGGGYDDRNFHYNVIPKMKCKQCGKSSPDSYRALSTKYSDGEVV